MTRQVYAPLPEFNLKQGATAAVGLEGLPESGLPHISDNYRTMAQLLLGGGEFVRSHYPPQTVYLAQVIDQRHPEHLAVMERVAHHAVEGPAEFVLVTADVEADGKLSPAAVAPVTGEEGKLGARSHRIVGRRGNIVWVSRDEVPADQEIIWTPFEGNLGIGPDQFEIVPGIGRVVLTGHAAQFKTVVKAPDVIFTDTDGSIRRTIQPPSPEFRAKQKSMLNRVQGLINKRSALII